MKANFTTLVNELATILRGGATYINHGRYDHNFVAYQTAPCRDWHGREQRKYPMHPAVIKALESDHRPYDWHLLTLEWPHVSESDSTRLAYTRDDRAGEADRQTVTTVGKYLTRHFPDMPDHEVRNLVALYAAGESCKWVYTMAEMLHHIMRGPHRAWVVASTSMCTVPMVYAVIPTRYTTPSMAGTWLCVSRTITLWVVRCVWQMVTASTSCARIARLMGTHHRMSVSRRGLYRRAIPSRTTGRTTLGSRTTRSAVARYLRRSLTAVISTWTYAVTTSRLAVAVLRVFKHWRQSAR
jgi:hypothetical protein